MTAAAVESRNIPTLRFFPPPVVSRNAGMIDRLTKVAYDLAFAAGDRGITVSDIRLEAYRRNILTGYERGRELSYLSAVPKAAALVATGRTRRSTLRITHGNIQSVWVHPAFSPYATSAK